MPGDGKNPESVFEQQSNFFLCCYGDVGSQQHEHSHNHNSIPIMYYRQQSGGYIFLILEQEITSICSGHNSQTPSVYNENINNRRILIYGWNASVYQKRKNSR
jgi:hypothetical protein